MPYDATLTSPPPLPDAPAAPVAHWTHTVALFVILLITTFYGHSQATAAAVTDAPRIPRYVSTVMAEWLLLGAVIAGIYNRRTFFNGAFLHRARGWGQSVGLAFAVYFSSALAVGFIRGLMYLTPIPHTVNIGLILAMTPHTIPEFFLWFLLSLSAGFCEELIFRGYLLHQFTAWTGRPILAILLGGTLFGCVHLYEGLGAILPLATLGILYGFVVRYFKGDLRAVIIAHFFQDFFVAFAALAIKHMPVPPCF